MSSHRLIEVVITSGTEVTTIHYSYDALGRRLSKSVNGDITYFIYDGEDIVGEMDSSGNFKVLYLHGPGIDEPIAMVRDVNGNGTFENNEVFVYTKDHLGSIRELTTLSGKVVQRYNYTSYGMTKLEKTNPDSFNFIQNSYAYTGREWEKETGDYYYRARFYDPGAGRFLSMDPIGFKSGDINLYRYVKNNPLAFIDSSGFSYKDIQDAITFVSAQMGVSPASYTAVLPAGSTGFALPPLNHILLDSKFTNDVLTDEQKYQLLAAVYHELTHLKDGFIQSVSNTKEQHDNIELEAQNWSRGKYRDFIRRQKNGECLLKL